jgi:DNA processing protein
VLVVEAGLKSGSLHTARFAADYGTPVFAVPGPYTSPRSRGCHAIIANGAQIAVSPEELLRDLGVAESLRQPDEDERHMEFSADEEAILQVLREGPRPTDLVARESGLPAAGFLAALLALRAKGQVRPMPGDLLVSSG